MSVWSLGTTTKNIQFSQLVTICDVTKSGDHSQNNLAKFGYILDMKVGKFFFKKILFLYSWLPTETYHENLAI